MGAHGRGTIKTDIPGEIQTGERFKVLALSQTELAEVVIRYDEPISQSTQVLMWYYPPADKVARVHQLYIACLQITPFATGTHSFEAYIGANRIVTKGQSAYNYALQYNYSHWYEADSLSLPPGAEAQGLILNNMYATLEIPITFIYSNNTNATQNNELVIKLTVELWGNLV